MVTTLTQIKARRSQADRRDESERRLLAAAAELVVEHGMGAATFEKIGARAGYSRGLVTQRFGSKRGLIEALINQLQGRLGGLLEDRRIEELNGLDAVLTYVEVFLSALDRDGELRAYFVVLAAAVADVSELRAPFAEAHKQVELALEAFFLRGQAEGVVRPGMDAGAAALITGALLFGLSMQLLLDPDMDLTPLRDTSLTTLRLSFAA
ncbi:MAG: TetR/AcrR family transcriptional regulator [Phenylobacterium sp.]|jgi:AcrR family transcriptional regulator|uniref:TetR/AcrR family transcriptional regulator n=1 Tax=Phenylobacterium sp. TaxID=1871053 RepID=UPI001B59668F|nr:TetR/AcrR family transcriptional regulator [Phenylobacterium sp.]MBP7650536.1 TetR/AcrR family transcriptional regulator [Phenylobacterium sp.]MBP7816507.1 TetR/AcrR family transcriptional regulator [Phenylobacterium sp.]MBP9231160.1 TetR/AcrR family transcriptional regulator [Phenylobacterium sp.]MBP9754098.1 TetR/AcrR family transcriptional regulator [Phenylobacterium sp.]